MKGEKGMRRRDVSYINISEKQLLVQLPLKLGQQEQVLGSLLLWAARKSICSLLTEHVLKYVP